MRRAAADRTERICLIGAAIGQTQPVSRPSAHRSAISALTHSTRVQPLNATLVTLVGQLSCRVNRLPPGMRARYHASAGFTSQFINALFSEAARVWESWGATEAEALQAMLPMARGTLASIESAGIARGMPGPVSRVDVGSVEKHVAALGALSEHSLDFYRTLCASTIPLAVERGSINEDTARRLREALRGPAGS